MSDYTTIRAALAAIPSPTRWLHRAKSNSLHAPPPAGTAYTYGAFIVTLGCDELTPEQQQVEGAAVNFITAADPATIAALLAALDDARRDAERYLMTIGSMANALESVKYEAISLADAQVIALEALTGAAMKGAA